MKHKFSYNIRFIDIVMLALGLSLAFYDMTVLQKGVKLIANANTFTSSIIALCIAMIANSFAAQWGKTNGENKATKAVNKDSKLGLIAWIAFGIGYAVIESIALFDAIEKGGIESIRWPNQIGQYVILALSYTFSGLMIENSCRSIFNADASSCRTSMYELKRLHKQIAKNESTLKELLNNLENYNQNYEILDKQYDDQLTSIRHAEECVMNEIEGKTLKANKEILPSDAHDIVNEIRIEFAR